MTQAVTVVAPAKVNLFLGVGARRPDGFHDVVTVLHALDLADEVRLAPSSGLSVTCDADLGLPPERNLAWRAAESLAARLGRSPDVAITLDKRVPHGAGLGGGSSDAAAVLAGLAALWDVDRADPVLVEVAGRLGADVPFFLGDGPALMAGRGDVLERRLPPVGADVVVVKPASGISTADAYEEFDRSPAPVGSPRSIEAALDAGDARALGAALGNNFEPVAAQLVPDVATALAWVRAAEGVYGAQVAGSGSAVFAVCDTSATAARLAEQAGARGWWGSPTKLRGAGVEVRTGRTSG
jgi:4-diphosphocytidyl-2-C-methyl-D-erythritol kinase